MTASNFTRKHVLGIITRETQNSLLLTLQRPAIASKSPLQLMLCHVVAVKSLSIHDLSDDIFWFFGIIGLNLSYFENTYLLKLVPGGLANVEHFITGHQKTQIKLSLLFSFLSVFLASKRSNYLELIYFIRKPDLQYMYTLRNHAHAIYSNISRL